MLSPLQRVMWRLESPVPASAHEHGPSDNSCVQPRGCVPLPRECWVTPSSLAPSTEPPPPNSRPSPLLGAALGHFPHGAEYIASVPPWLICLEEPLTPACSRGSAMPTLGFNWPIHRSITGPSIPGRAGGRGGKWVCVCVIGR